MGGRANCFYDCDVTTEKGTKERVMRRRLQEGDRNRMDTTGQKTEGRGACTKGDEGVKNDESTAPYNPIKPRMEERVPVTVVAREPTSPVTGGARFPTRRKAGQQQIWEKETAKQNVQIWNSLRPMAEVVKVVPVMVKRMLDATRPVPRETADPEEERGPTWMTAVREKGQYEERCR
jgi:hypothetical protein